MPEYQGQSTFLRGAPYVLLGLAAVTLLSRWNHSLQFAALFMLCSFLFARWLACAFTVRADGINLAFPFGRHRFLPKESVRIRIDVVGALAIEGRRRHWRYPLFDGILYVPDRDASLRKALLEHGYEIA